MSAKPQEQQRHPAISQPELQLVLQVPDKTRVVQCPDGETEKNLSDDTRFSSVLSNGDSKQEIRDSSHSLLSCLFNQGRLSLTNESGQGGFHHPGNVVLRGGSDQRSHKHSLIGESVVRGPRLLCKCLLRPHAQTTHQRGRTCKNCSGHC